MSYKSLLSDRCDIYHLKEDHAEEARYGIPAPNLQPIRTYGETPDLQNVPCYFTEKNQSIVQQDPEQVIIIHIWPIFRRMQMCAFTILRSGTVSATRSSSRATSKAITWKS